MTQDVATVFNKRGRPVRGRSPFVERRVPPKGIEEEQDGVPHMKNGDFVEGSFGASMSQQTSAAESRQEV